LKHISSAIDILVLSNGPGEVMTWVRPVVQAVRQRMGNDRQTVRISLVLSPCPNASGREVAMAQTYPEIDRIQAAEHFWPFLLRGKTAAGWDWHPQGVVVFLGGDQVFPVIIGKRLGYRTVVYGEWETRWHRWIDYFGVMKPDLVKQAPVKYADKFMVVGDLMAEAGSQAQTFSGSDAVFPDPDAATEAVSTEPVFTEPVSTEEEWIGLLPGSKAAKLAQGVPLCLAIARHLHHARPHTRFVLPVAPTLDVQTLARFADVDQNPMVQVFEHQNAELVQDSGRAYLKTAAGLQIDLHLEFPAYEVLRRCCLCFTTVGANTAELAALGVPMIVLLPTQQLDAMRAWDGIPGLLANLPGVGTAFAKLINAWFLRKSRLLAWPNIWAGEAIVPELMGKLQPQEVAEFALNWLSHPEELEQVRKQLRRVRGQAGAAQKLAQLIEMAAQPI
jgi:hypothetical protein